ncbi:unnamed protein product [Rangifer tarandus platyrhynchus]|uniref:Uncharacterized protein n=1 Tax=Rangifer tarandus platyrhynchus TaxID=3082113 RepID=A0AC59Y923_RANTA
MVRGRLCGRTAGRVLRALAQQWCRLVKVIGLRVRQTWGTSVYQCCPWLYLPTPHSPGVHERLSGLENGHWVSTGFVNLMVSVIQLIQNSEEKARK